jgi:hypothetical protein
MEDVVNFKPFVAKDFLPQEIYDVVYDAINRQIEKNIAEGKEPYAEPFVKAGSNGFIILFDPIPNSFYDFLREKISKSIGFDIATPGILFARYTHDSGYAPRLLPHADRAVKTKSVTMTVELDSTLDWDIYIEDDRHKLGKNSAIFFSGSHQTHFRPHQEFSKDDYYDILLIQTAIDLPNQDEITEENHFNYMDKRAGDFIVKYKDVLEGSLNNLDVPRN